MHCQASVRSSRFQEAFAGLVAMAREGAFRPEERVLFIHTGGAGGLCAIDL